MGNNQSSRQLSTSCRKFSTRIRGKISLNEILPTEENCKQNKLNETSIEKACFIILPPEVRKMIYSYLIPDRTVPAIIWDNQGRRLCHEVGCRDFRLDRGACCPALLRTNRLVFTEMVEMIYTSTFFELALTVKFRFLGNEYDRFSDLPFNFTRLKKLLLAISVGGLFFREDDKSSSSQRHHQLRQITKYLSAEGPAQIQDLTIKIKIHRGFYQTTPYAELEDASTWPAKIRKSLESSLDPLREIRASRKVIVCLGCGTWTAGCYGAYREQVEKVTRGYFAELKAEISGTYDAKEALPLMPR